MVDTGPSTRRTETHGKWQNRRAGPFRWVTGLPLFWAPAISRLRYEGDKRLRLRGEWRRESRAYLGIGRLTVYSYLHIHGERGKLSQPPSRCRVVTQTAGREPRRPQQAGAAGRGSAHARFGPADPFNASEGLPLPSMRPKRCPAPPLGPPLPSMRPKQCPAPPLGLPLVSLRPKRSPRCLRVSLSHEASTVSLRKRLANLPASPRRLDSRPRASCLGA